MPSIFSMRFIQKVLKTGTLFVMLAFLLGCTRPAPAPVLLPPVASDPTRPVVEVAPFPTLTIPPPADAAPSPQPTPGDLPVQYPREAWKDGEPAGCLTANRQAEHLTNAQMLDYADQLLALPRPLSRRLLPRNWNEYSGQFTPYQEDVLTLSVADLSNQYWLQRILNALHVAGFVAWLRDSQDVGLHILAIPLRDSNWKDTAWASYVEAYWQERHSLPAGDPNILPALKLPPCQWMVDQAFTRPVDEGWFVENPVWPDYAAAASAYLADTTEDAALVAGKIDWLGPEGQEGPNTMCGPLVWSIMSDAGALPPDFGGWSLGSKAFWLSRPKSNGRPWSLFPPDTYQVYSYSQPLGEFDFSQWPLYPGDFLYTYSKGDGFDHMLLVTEVDSAGDVYTVTNRVQVVPQTTTTVERLLLLNLHDLVAGIARQGWHNDRKNGRTGHYGFDVFRWAWMEKNIQQQPAAYTVQPGDTLTLIAERWKTPSALIARYNGITPGEPLSVGQEIQIPPNEPREGSHP